MHPVSNIFSLEALTGSSQHHGLQPYSHGNTDQQHYTISVSDLERYVNREKHPAMKYNFFGIPGMTTAVTFDQALEDLKEINPRYG